MNNNNNENVSLRCATSSNWRKTFLVSAQMSEPSMMTVVEQIENKQKNNKVIMLSTNSTSAAPHFMILNLTTL